MNNTIYVKGMHCVSCEMLLEKEVLKIKGVLKTNISHRKGTLNVNCDGEMPFDEIEKAVEKCGYKVAKEDEEKFSKVKKSIGYYILILLIFIVVGNFAYILKGLEVAKYFPEIGENAGVMIALLFGVVASLSTCLILIGGIVLSFGSMYEVKEDAKHPLISRALPHVYFHVGRIVGFGILGGILGLLGSKINYSVSFTGYLTIFVAIVMLYIGLQIIEFVPSITKLGFHLPKKLSKKIDKLQENNHPLTPMIIGVLTFLLPCGFTQSMQLAAVASGSFVTGALIMSVFAIGTFPALFSLGLGSSYARNNKFGIINKVIGVVVIFFALYSLNSGMILSGANLSLDFWNSGNSGVVSSIVNDVQVVKMDVDWSFKPSEFVVKKGVPVRWEINGINVSGCTNKIVIPSLKLSIDINSGMNVLEFTPEKVGTIQFTCWMGMQGGKFIVEE